jgi:two-component system sensor histidine kinase HydH
MKRTRISLGMKFSIAVTALIVFSMTAVATLIIHYQERSLRENISQSNLAMTKKLAHDAEGALLLFDPLRLNEFVMTVKEASECAYALIVDQEGLIVAHTSRENLGLPFPGFTGAGLNGSGEREREYHAGNELVNEFTVPILIGKETIGAAVVAYSVSAVDKAIASRLKNLRRYIFVITGIMIIAGVGAAFAVSTVLTKPLLRLKDRMLDVQAGNLNVEADNPGIVRCWTRLGCDRKDCPAYGKVRCWAIAGTFCHGSVQGAFAQKIGDCRKCAVYQESCGDEIKELVEAFNQMVKDLRFNLGELQKATTEKARLERLSALGEMAATVAHETKNPLNAIRLATSYLKNNFQGDILTEFLKIIEEEVERLNDITTGFLGFSKPAPLKPKPSSINSIVKSSVDLIRQEATDRNIEVLVLTDEHVPPVVCDGSQLKQALLNLLINAMDAAGSGGTVSVTTEGAGSQVTIAVHDSGPGIRPDQMEKIFKPFFTTKTRGSGLGLAIAERILKEHKGEITVTSEPGKGTTFILSLPVYEYATT